MCCFRSIGAGVKFRSRNKNKKRITVWKVVRDNGDGSIQSPYRQTKINYGWFKSDRQSTSLTSTEANSIGLHKGIHVLRTRAEAKSYLLSHWDSFSSRKVIKCEACVNDFVASSSDQGELVFTKIWVPKPKKK